MFARATALASSLAVAACSVIGDRSGTEEPSYQVVAQAGAVEIRSYGPRLAAETAVEGDEEAARNAGFRRLAGYIFGGNTAQAKIAMTAPVAQSSAQTAGGEQIAMTAPVAQARDGAGRWVVRFFLPREWTLQTLPVPDDRAVRLVTVPAETVAVLGFTGSRAASAVAERKAALQQELSQTPWTTVGTPVAWFYDPPWTLPWLRRNEVAVPVSARVAEASR